MGAEKEPSSNSKSKKDLKEGENESGIKKKRKYTKRKNKEENAKKLKHDGFMAENDFVEQTELVDQSNEIKSKTSRTSKSQKSSKHKTDKKKYLKVKTERKIKSPTRERVSSGGSEANSSKENMEPTTSSNANQLLRLKRFDLSKNETSFPDSEAAEIKS